MKILFIVTWYSSKKTLPMKEGVFHYEQVFSLKNYCDVRLLYPYDQQIEKLFSYENENGINVYRIKQVNNRIKRYWNYLKYIRKIIEEFHPDLIHAQVANCAGFFAFIISKIYKIPYIITEHNPVELLNLNSKITFLKNELVYKNSQGNYCVSSYLKECLSREFNQNSFELVYNGVIDPKSFLTSGEKKDTSNNCVIVASFYDKEIKGFQFLLPAIREVLKVNKNIKLHICGGGEYLQYYKELAFELGIENNVIFYDQCEKKVVYRIIDICEFLISSSLYESAGVTVEEALLLGKPVLVTDSGGANSLVDETNSIVVKKGSVESLADGILKLMEKKEMFDSDIIRNNALKNFEITNISERYVKIYNDVIGLYKKI